MALRRDLGARWGLAAREQGEFQIPRPTDGSDPDFFRVNVVHLNGADRVPFFYVGSRDRCDPVQGGWYDDDARGVSPTKILVCPANCQALPECGRTGASRARVQDPRGVPGSSAQRLYRLAASGGSDTGGTTGRLADLGSQELVEALSIQQQDLHRSESEGVTQG